MSSCEYIKQTERCFHEELPLCVAIFFNVCISKIKPPELDSIEKCILIALDIFISMVIIVVIEQTKKNIKKYATSKRVFKNANYSANILQVFGKPQVLTEIASMLHKYTS